MKWWQQLGGDQSRHRDSTQPRESVYEQRARDAPADDEFDHTPWIKLCELDPRTGEQMPT